MRHASVPCARFLCATLDVAHSVVGDDDDDDDGWAGSKRADALQYNPRYNTLRVKRGIIF